MKTMKSAIAAMLIVLVAVFASCKEGENSAALLRGHEWQLKSLTIDGAVITNPAELPVLEFSDSTKMAGSAGCNRFFGNYIVADKGAITLVPGGFTMMICPDIEFEDKYIKALPEVKTYVVSKEELILKDAEGKLEIVYIATPGKSAESKTVAQ